RGFSFAESVTTATAPAWIAWSMKRLPSDVSPCMATNTHPGLTRRESYSTLLTLRSPVWLRTSAPSRRCWKVIARNYRPPRICAWPLRALFPGRWALPRSFLAGGQRALHYSYEHWNQPLQVSLCAVRTTREFVRVRKIL